MEMVYAIISFDFNQELKSNRMKNLEMLRGNMISKFRNEIRVHNHFEDGKSVYKFPEVQYKYIKNKLSIMFLNDIDLIMKIMKDIKKIKMGEIEYTDFKKDVVIKEYDVKYIENDFITYEFVSDYIPFNQKNYDLYLKANYSLEKAIINNILEFLKGIGLRLNEDEIIRVEKINLNKQNKIVMKNTEFLTFKLSFATNVDLPNYISLGKRKSIGFGVIKKKTNK
ncbi:CRISPR-associated endonuclease Cas6 [Streptobacillus canis]|uniref:CRISPR-associated endonuclease Cas6 n=1 Tax=Streptobacillus canis TaxID=2678686 RepID=UPI0012E30349|nr:CRISPR-associated endonuclease Cas6 [Streptobacillus canis]